MARKTKLEKLLIVLMQMLHDIEEHLLKCQTLTSSFEIQSIRHIVNAPFGAAQTKWPVISIYRKKIIDFNTEHERLKILNYCPHHTEFSEEIVWYEDEVEASSFVYQLLSIHESVRRDEIIKHNLLKDPSLIYERTVCEWKSAHENSDNIAKNPKNLHKLSFAPKKGQTLKQAYESVAISRRKRESRHRQNLRMRYKKNLLEAVFDGIPFDDSIREGYLWDWEQRIFEKEMTPRLLQEDRWAQCYAVDHNTAGKCLQWLIEQFLANPTKKRPI